MITVNLSGIGCKRFEGPGAMEHACKWIQQARDRAEEDPWLADTPDDLGILRALALGGSMNGIQIANSLSRPKGAIRKQILTLSRREHLRITGRSCFGGGKVWEITAAGKDALKELEKIQTSKITLRSNGD